MGPRSCALPLGTWEWSLCPGQARSTEGGQKGVRGPCPHPPGSWRCQGRCEWEDRRGWLSREPPFLAEGGKVGAGFSGLANWFPASELVPRALATLARA